MRRWRAVLWMLLTLVVHPLMALFGAVWLVFLAWPPGKKLPHHSSLAAFPFAKYFEPTSPAWREAIRLGLQAFVRVQLRHHDAESVAAFARFVNDWDEVVACHALTGEMDYLLHIAVQDLEHFSRFLLDRLLAQAGVADVNSSFVLRTVKAFRGMPLPAG